MKIEFALDEQAAGLLNGVPEPEIFLQQFFREILDEYIGTHTPPRDTVLWKFGSSRPDAFLLAKAEEITARLKVAEGFKVADFRLVD